MKVKETLRENWLVIIILILFTVISVIKLEHPGVHNDQLMFVNAATFRPDAIFLWQKWHGLPVMVFQYIGALKSYIYMPIFYLFGVNIWTIRLPQILLMVVALLILYLGIKRLINKTVALITTLFLAVDASLIAHTRVDTGPVVIEFLAKAATIYLVALFLKKWQLRYYWLIWGVMLLGLFNKLNFIWYVNAFLVGFGLVYGLDFFRQFRKRSRLFPYVLVILPYLIVLRFFLKFSGEVTANYKGIESEVGFHNLINNWSVVWGNVGALLNGQQFYELVYGLSPLGGGQLVVGLIVLVIIAGFLIKSDWRQRRVMLFFSLIIIVTLVEVLLTRKATKAWHAFTIYPFVTVLLSWGFYQLYHYFQKKWLKYLVIGLGWGLVSYMLAINYLYIRQYSQPTAVVAYSSKIYELIDWSRQRPEHFICLDVDICNQQLSLTQQSHKYYEPFSFLDPAYYQQQLDQYLGSAYGGKLYVGHGTQTTHFPEFRDRFFNYAAAHNLKLNKIKEISDGDRVVFEVYQVEP